MPTATTTPRRAALAGVAAATVFALAGCGGNDGPSDYDKMVAARKEKADTLAGAGVKTQQKQYPIGTGWVVDMTGVTVTDDLLRQVKDLGIIAELDLKKSTVTDAHLGLMHELGLHILLAKLDLSNTAVTDAGLDKLDGTIFLSELNLTGTKVTPAAVERFKQKRQANPNAKIKNTTVRR